jgi:hypothetical protein
MRPQAAILPVSLPRRPDILAGREGLLTDLHALMTTGDRPWPRIVALCGLGGVGKTSVAVEYAHRHLAELGLAWQVAAENPAVLSSELAELAAQLGVRDVIDLRDPVATLHGVLAAYQAEWLLIFDNVTEESSVRRFIPTAGRGRVLITSQSQHWSGTSTMDVAVPDDESAAAFLSGRTGDLDHPAAAELADLLGRLPLALEQAAAYIQATGLTLARYLTLFRQRSADLLRRGDVAGHPASIATTLGLAVTNLEAEHPAAARLLRLLACLAPTPVPLDLLTPGIAQLRDADEEIWDSLSPILSDQVAAADAIAALRRYSLVTPATPETIQVHRLVQAVTLDQIPAEEAVRWRRTAAALTEAAIPADPMLPEVWPLCSLLLPHAQAVLLPTAPGTIRMAWYVGNSGNYSEARELFAAIADQHLAAYGPEHPATLAVRSALAYWSGEVGDPAAGRDQYATLVPALKKVCGPQHPDTLMARANLATMTGQAGDPAAARDQHLALLPIREAVSGAEHPATLIDRAFLAYWTGEAGDPTTARDQYAVILPLMEAISSSEHPATMKVRENLAWWTGEAGDPTAARDQLALLLPIRERLSGSEHPETLAIRANLAWWTGSAGSPAAARDQYLRLQPVLEKVSGREHPHTLDLLANLAYWTGEAGDPVAARDQLVAVLAAMEKRSGQDHQETLAARANLARWTGEAGDPAVAIEQYAAVLPAMERVFGPDHPSILAARENILAFNKRIQEAQKESSGP